MKTSYTTAIALAISTLIAGQAFAADTTTADGGKTRADVIAEMAEARRTGDIMASTETTINFGNTTAAKLNEVFPSRYPAVAAVPTKTRAEVRTELAEAQRTGDLPAGNLESLVYAGVPGQKLKDVYPTQYPVKARASALTQVVASAN